MKKVDIQVGGHYRTKVNGRLTTVRVVNIREVTTYRRGFGAKPGNTTVYDVTNLATGKRTIFRSAQKFIAPAKMEPKWVETRNDGTVYDQSDELVSAEEDDNSPDPTTPATSPAPGAGGSPTTATARKPSSATATPVNPATTDGSIPPFPTAGTLASTPLARPITTPSNHPLTAKEVQMMFDAKDRAALAEDLSPGVTPEQVEATVMEGKQRPDPTVGSAVRTGNSSDAIPTSGDDSELAGLAGDQPAAFRAVTGRLAAGQPVVKLTGYAGTGKTFLTARVASWALRNRDRYRKVTVVAPTHKAAGVIEAKLVGAGVPVGDGKGAVDVRTIHSLLGLRLEPDMENDTGGRILLATEKKEKPKGLVICDEASMVGSVLKEHVERAAEVQWLFVGDLAQLPPVGEGVSELLDNPDAELRTVLRQAKGSEILNLATRIREGDLSTEFEAGRDVHKVGSAEDLFQAALAVFNTDAYRADAGHARMLVFKNLRRQAINRRMRDLLIGAEEPYVAGEWLVMYAAFCPEKSKLNLMAERAREYAKGTREYGRAWRNFFEYKERHCGDDVTRLHVSEEVRVEAGEDGEVKVGGEPFKVHRLAVRARGEIFDLPVLQQLEVARVRKIMDELTQTALQLRKERDEQPERSSAWERLDKERRQAWSYYFTLEETFAQVDYAYAMTVHKSQGSTFAHAFVDVPDLLSAGGMQQRILYTACTRPAKSLTFYR